MNGIGAVAAADIEDPKAGEATSKGKHSFFLKSLGPRAQLGFAPSCVGIGADCGFVAHL